jgi:phosphatidylglycerol:prolipoprotein diacylglycerol transferase
LGQVLALGPIGLSMGQLLSIPMILAGLAMILAGKASAQSATNTNGATT